jgi:competence protein ComEC
MATPTRAMADYLSDTLTGFRVHALDVGQGDSILLEGPSGDTILIDSGPKHDTGETVLNYLDEHNIDHLNHFVATHYDADHIGGHAAIVEEFGPDHIGEVHGPDMSGIKDPDSDTMKEYQRALVKAEMNVNQLQKGSSDLHLDDIDINVLNPSPDNPSNDRNENSVVMQCTYAEQDVLLTGDIGHETEARLVEEYPDKLSQVDAVKIAHHGSKYSTSNEFLAACDAETAVFSHAEQNRDDHPNKETLYRTADDTDTAISTALHSSTVLDFDGEDTITVQNATSTANFAVMTRYCREHDEDFDTALVEENALAYEDLPQDIPLGVVNDTSNVELPKEVQQLREEKKEIQNDKKDVPDRNDDLYNTINELLNDKKDLIDGKREIQSKNNELREENWELQNETEDLREQVDDLQTTLNDFIDTNQSEAETEASTTVEMNNLSPSQQVTIAITASETVEEVRQTLEDHPDAADHLHDIVQTDREEHVTTMADVNVNKEKLRRAKQAERTQYPLHKQIRSKVPNRFGGTTLPTENIPSPDEIEGPRKYEDLHPAVREETAAEHRETDVTLAFTPDYLVTAEETADTAVDTAETGKQLCEALRDTPGAHKDFLYAITTPNAHHAHEETEPEESVEQTPTQQREQSTERSRDTDRDKSMGLSL